MLGQKRPLSPESPRDTSTKRQSVAPPLDVTDDDEDSLESILAQIEAQEQSEALARKLQAEWDVPGPSNPSGAGACNSTSTLGDVIVISNDEEEDDETMARRLEKQWELEDVVPCRTQGNLSGSLSTLKGKAKSRSTTAPTPTSVLEQYKQLFTGTRTCSCGVEIPSPRGHVMYSQQIPPPSLLHLLHAACKSCKINHCRGCLSPVSCSLSCKGKLQNEDCPLETCCADERVIALFEALGAFDRQYLGERATTNERAREAAANLRKKTSGSSVGPGGTGYGTGREGAPYGGGLPYTMAYAGHGNSGYSSYRARGRGQGRVRGRSRGGSSSQADDVPHRDPLAAHFDEIIVRALQTITNYLPSPYSDNAQIFDMLPHPATGTLLLLSQLPDLLGSLLRNDSVTDWIARLDVYHAMLALLRRMADCELTLEVLTAPRCEMAKSCGLEDWMWGDGEIVWERDEANDALVPALPLYAHFKKLTKQCETFLTGASSMLDSASDGEDTETMIKATSLCGDIIAVKDDIERAMVAMGKDPSATLSECPVSTYSDEPTGKGKGRDPAIDMERTYARECERLAFQHVSLSRPIAHGTGLDYPGYNYSRELAQTANATRSPKDRLHLVKELAVMATSLPPGVWVRVDEVRNDAVKIMIAGPEGTPYTGGLFEFDCFIPLEYPNKPPLMHLRTTGGGTVRFNPNLYNNGKVCLSLLGTWQGRPEEQWSRKSSLLQVVVSIQSMILVDLPYFNEPGFGQANPNHAASIQYNRNTTLQTTCWAIVEWLKDEHKDGLWGEVIASHFLTRHDKIHKCIQEWATAEPAIRKYRPGMSSPSYMPPGLGIILPPPLPSIDAMEEDAGLFMGSWSSSYPGPAAIALSKSMSSGHTRAGRHRGLSTDTAQQPADLLVQYEEGIQKIRQWGLMSTGDR